MPISIASNDTCILADPPPVRDHDTICIWWTDLDWVEDTIASAWGELSPDERDRACRYRRLIDRNRFIAARTCLRRILSSYVNAPAAAICFECGEHGKSRLTSEFEEYNIQFNVAHSHGLAAVAVAFGQEIGVDVERVEPTRHCVELAHRFFAKEEQQAIEALAPEARVRAFYRCWTRKEAYLKAIGAGLFVALDSFVVSVLDDARPTWPRDILGRPRDCTLIDISPNPAFAAAVAVLGSRERQYHTAHFQCP